jgi:uncharacterized membrane protein
MKKQFFVNVLILSVISALGLILRLQNVTQSQLWYDEAYTGLMAQMPWADLRRSLLQDVHPPFYIFLVKFLTQFFGISDFNLRIISVALGTLLIPLSYYFFKLVASSSRKFTSMVGPYAFSFIIAINPFLIGYSQEARSYMLAGFLYILTLICFINAREKSFLKFNLWWAFYALFTLVIFLTHYISFLGIIALTIFDFAFYKESFWNHFLKKLLLYFEIFILPIVILAIYSKYVLLNQYSNAPVQWWIPFVDLTKIPESLYAFFFGVYVKSLGVPGYLNNLYNLKPETIGFIIFAFILSIGTYIFAKSNFKNKDKILLLFFGGIIPIVGAILMQNFGMRLYVERYLLQYSILIIALVSFLAFKMKNWIWVLLILVYFANTIYVTYLASNSYSDGIKKIVALQSEYTAQKPLVIFDNPIDFVVAKYYFALEGNSDQVKIDNIGFEANHYSDWEMIPNSGLLNNYSELKDKSRIFVYSDANNIRDVWYREEYQFDKYIVLSTLPKVQLAKK